MMIKKCEFCGKEIKTKFVSKKFCDSTCQRRNYESKPEIKEKNRKRVKEYRKRPEVKERNRILAVTKYRERRKKFWKEYGKRPEVREKIRMQEKLRRQTDKEYAIADRLRRSLNHAMNRYSKIGKIMSSKKYGINWKKLIESLEPFPKNINEFEIDHIKPLKLFNLTKSNQVKKAFSPKNLQWLTIEENRKKGGKYPIKNEQN